MKDYNGYDSYESEIKDVDDFNSTEIKINPDFYIHTALLKAQQSLAQDNVKEGFLKYRVFIEHIETICKAANILDQDYFDCLKKFKDELSKDLTDDIRQMKIANKKLELIMTCVFDNKLVTDPAKA